ncbi:MAG: mechanosensitive ion channel [Wenzhouxiangellaceae bacterium]|nr:mechanosensitive ion channel [Wenzhouxiangellaceae bacterium]
MATDNRFFDFSAAIIDAPKSTASITPPPDRHARRWTWLALSAALAVAALLGLAHAAAQTESAELGDRRWVEEASAAIDEAEQQLETLDRSATPRETLEAVRVAAARVRDESQACLTATESRQSALTSRLEALGEATSAESPEVQQTRQTLEGERVQLEARESACRLLRLRAQELADAAADKAQALMTERLLVRGPHLGGVLSEIFANPLEPIAAIADRMAVSLTGLSWSDAALLVLLVLASLLASRAGARIIRPSSGPAVADCVSGGAIALRAATARMLPLLLAALAVSVYLAWVTGTTSINARASYAITIWLAGLTVIRMVLRPPKPARPFLPLDDALQRSLFVRATVLSVLLLVGFLAFALIPWKSGSETALLLLRGVYAGALAINLIWILTLTGSFLHGALWRVLRGAAGALLLITLGAEWLGYRTLAPYLLRGVAGTVVVMILGALIARFFADLFDGLDEGRLHWQQRLRARLGLAAGNPVPGLMWLRVLVTLLIWGFGSYLVLLSWGLSAEGTTMLGRWLTEGFDIGDVQLVPTQILAALLVFGVLTTLLRWMHQSVVPGWLRRTRLDTGAREAVTAIGNYIGVAVAVIVALSMAGIRFQNLAIVVGALSVGIGFGLQNIVNNFVSGLILLFERPIRRGDWIEVGNTEGYVRQISIRSTRLETFDRAEVIIPNAELATTQVVNWQLRDSWGRVIVPVAVAYGSDTAKVRDVLLRVAHTHPNTMRGGLAVPDPVVLFRCFGDSALDFELRFFIPQIDQRLHVISDINFAIDAAFREEGIEIPFPQRDIHLKGPLPDAHKPNPEEAAEQ